MKQRMVIGIAGGSGSGKTTLAANIAHHFGDKISLLRHDDYYKSQKDIPLEERAAMNYDHPSAFDTDLLIHHLDKLKQGVAVDCPTYDYTIHDRSDKTRRVEATDVILLEGILIFEDEALRDLMDIKIFVDTDADVRLCRRIKRDVTKRGRSLESVLNQYQMTVKPMHEKYVEPSKKHANLVVLEGGKNWVALDMIVGRIQRHLDEVAE